MAAPSKYKEEYNEQVEKLCKLGATDKEIADFFDVTEQTVNNWKNDKKGFFESIKKGKIIADAEVADKLYQRACGYSHPAVKILTNRVKEYNEEGKVSNESVEPLIVDYTEHYPPDTGAAFIWLKNRQPDKWRDKPERNDDIEELLKTIVHGLQPIPEAKESD